MCMYNTNSYNPIKFIQLGTSQHQSQNINSSTVMKFIGTLDLIISIAMYVHGIALPPKDHTPYIPKI